MNRNKSICVALVLVLCGCNSLSFKERQKLFNTENDAYVGKHYDQLIKGKGVPTGTATLSDSGKVIEYFTSQVEITGGGFYGYPSGHYVGNANGTGTWVYADHIRSIPLQYWNTICKIDFIVTPQNVVESWKYDGKGCY